MLKACLRHNVAVQAYEQSAIGVLLLRPAWGPHAGRQAGTKRKSNNGKEQWNRERKLERKKKGGMRHPRLKILTLRKRRQPARLQKWLDLLLQVALENILLLDSTKAVDELLMSQQVSRRSPTAITTSYKIRTCAKNLWVVLQQVLQQPLAV